MMESNRDESLRCLKLAEAAWRNLDDLDKAKRLARKSIKLFPSQEAQELLSILESQSCNEESSANSRPSSRRFTGTTPTNRTNLRDEMPNGSVEYTPDQVEAVKRVRQCHDFYEILGVSKTANDAELKKAYRKQALRFHPDKNKAPGAGEAFKAIGNSFSVLSNPEKRKQYDLYGPDMNNSRSGRSNFNDYDPSHGFESDMTAEEIFNMFFGGGFPSQTVYVRRGGGGGVDATGRYRQNAHTQRSYHHQGQREQQQANGYAAIIQLMPILLIIFMSIFSSFFVSDPLFSLQQSQKYSLRRTTRNMRFPYYVKKNFETDFTGSLGRLESTIEEDFINNLRQECFRDKSRKESLLWQARYSGNSALLSKAYEYRTPSCDRLEKIYSYS